MVEVAEVAPSSGLVIGRTSSATLHQSPQLRQSPPPTPQLRATSSGAASLSVAGHIFGEVEAGIAIAFAMAIWVVGVLVGLLAVFAVVGNLIKDCTKKNGGDC